MNFVNKQQQGADRSPHRLQPLEKRNLRTMEHCWSRWSDLRNPWRLRRSQTRRTESDWLPPQLERTLWILWKLRPLRSETECGKKNGVMVNLTAGPGSRWRFGTYLASCVSALGFLYCSTLQNIVARHRKRPGLNTDRGSKVTHLKTKKKKLRFWSHLLSLFLLVPVPVRQLFISDPLRHPTWTNQQL